ncbi:MAG: response regulator [Deltaproteobacteria bacterium]|nr:MAG: response regulator [Deltaproteobacteria bacterium]
MSAGQARHLALLHAISATLSLAAFLAVPLAPNPGLGTAYAVFALIAGAGFAAGQLGHGRIGSLLTACAPLAVPYAGFLHLVQGQSVVEVIWLALATAVGVLLLPLRGAYVWAVCTPLVSGLLMQRAGIPFDATFRVTGASMVVGAACAVASLALSHRDKTVQAQRHAYEQTQLQLQSALREARLSAETKDRFLAVLTHELRTPLTGVLGGARLLLEAPLPPEQRRTTEIIHKSGSSLLALIDDLLDVSRLNAGSANLNLEPADAMGVIEEQLQALATSGRAFVPVVYVGPPVLPMVMADRRRLGQVLANLLGNAAKYTREGHIAISATIEDQRLGIRVRDTGPGIHGKDRERIFQAFEQLDTRRGGAGLGLSIARGLIEAMGGALELGPEQDRGATLVAWVPIAAHLPLGETTGEGLSALVAHPLVEQQRAIVAWMQEWGYGVVAASDEQSALESLSAREFDVLVISDRLRLPRHGALPGHRVWIGRDRAPHGETALDTPLLPGPLRTALLDDLLVDPDSGSTATPVPAPIPARILLAEDNATNRMVLRAMLGTLGCRVQVVENGVQAIDAVGRGRFDLVLMDCHMPDMDGFEATRAIVASGADVPVVALTASASDDVRQRCVDAGMADFITKPVSLERLRREVRRHCAFVPAR